MANALTGSCHCGNLSLELHGADTDLAARACTCSFCVARRARWISVPGGEVVLAVTDESATQRYRFGTRTADFVLCRNCGVHLAATCEIDGALYAVINLDCIASLRDAVDDAAPISFDGEQVDDRLARRQRTWTPARWR